MRLGSRRAAFSLSVLVLASLMLFPAFSRSEEEKPWGPYLKDKKGEVKPLPEKIEKMKDEDWQKIAYTDFRGMKPRLAVIQRESKEDDVSSKDMNSDIGRLAVLFSRRGGTKEQTGVDNPEIQLRQALGATSRFRLVEGSTSADKILNEQDFGASGRVSGASASKLGRITGSQYAATVTIIEINPEKEARNIKLLAGGITSSMAAIGSVGMSGTVAYCCVNVKIVNTESGEIVTDLTAQGTSKSHGASFGMGALKGMTHGLVGAGGMFDSKSAPSLNEAIQVCVNKIAYLTAGRFEDLPLSMNVLGADASRIQIEGGRDLGIQEGMELSLEKNLGAIVDAKGDTLEWDRAANGLVKVVRVMPTVSFCEIVNGGKDAKRGDFAVFEPKKKR